MNSSIPDLNDTTPSLDEGSIIDNYEFQSSSRTKDITKRIRELESDRNSITEQFNIALENYNTDSSNKNKKILSDINFKLLINEDLLNKLYTERLKLA